jgi:putative hydrolase of the HAD superfamily
VSSHRVAFFDLDDTLLVLDADVEPSWRSVAAHVAAEVGGVDAETFWQAVSQVSTEYWSDEERHRAGRIDMLRARREIALQVVERWGRTDVALAHRIADAYTRERRSRERPFDGAVELLERLASASVRMALVTNGSSDEQRRKVERFGLGRYFAAIVIEGEVGAGKPDPTPFLRALEAMAVAPEAVTMVGNDLARDIAPARALGMRTIWHDHLGTGLPADAPQPDHSVRSMPEIEEALMSGWLGARHPSSWEGRVGHSVADARGDELTGPRPAAYP